MHSVTAEVGRITPGNAVASPTIGRDSVADTDPASASPGRLIASFAMTCVCRCANRVLTKSRETLAERGREGHRPSCHCPTGLRLARRSDLEILARVIPLLVFDASLEESLEIGRVLHRQIRQKLSGVVLTDIRCLYDCVAAVTWRQSRSKVDSVEHAQRGHAA